MSRHYPANTTVYATQMTKLIFSLMLLLGAQGAFAQTAAEPGSDASILAAANALQAATVKVRLQTSLGDIVLVIEKDRAPITSTNFLRYVDQKRLDGIGFYRAVKLGDTGEYGLVQGGVRGDPKRVLKSIPHEPTTVTGLTHISGAISMAPLAPGTATMEFFIVLGAFPNMDAQPEAPGDNQGYAVFGRVIDGMEVVKAILEQPHSLTEGEGVMKGQMLEKPVKIVTARRIE